MRSEGYSTWPVCLSVTTFSATVHNKVDKKWYHQLQCYTGKIWFLLEYYIQKLWCEMSEKGNMVMSTDSPQLVFAALRTVEASPSKVTPSVKGCIQRYLIQLSSRSKKQLWAYGYRLYASSQMYSSIQACLQCNPYMPLFPIYLSPLFLLASSTCTCIYMY